MTFRRVLVIDDDPYVVHVAKLCLASMTDIGIYGAATGYQGLEFANRAAPDLILLDFSLPGMDGLQALSHLRANIHTAHIPVIAITGTPRSDARCSKMISECEGYLPKPFDFKQFGQVVLHYLTADLIGA